MTEAFDSFNAPQFVDFSEARENFTDISTDTDAYFDIDHEHDQKGKSQSEFSTFYSPLEFPPDSTSHSNGLLDPLETSCNNEESRSLKLRKSMSVGNLILFTEEEYTPFLDDIGEKLENININQNGVVKTHISSHQEKKPCRSSATSGTSNNTFFGKDSQKHLNKLAQPKRYASVENLKEGNNGKFISFAEAMNQFQNRTPVRFRSKPNLAQNHSSQTLFRTVPESPALQTKARSRPVHVLSHEEREKIEFENHQRFKIKAHPVNKKILQGPVKPTVPIERKAPTKPQPFNLTSAQPKKIMPSPKKYEFHAKPMPRSAEKPKKQQEIVKRPPTKPKTPSFMKNYKRPIHETEEKVRKNSQSSDKDDTTQRKPTKPVPFSFEHRDKMIEKKREQLINKIREEERKAREFHAKPVPKFIYKKDDSIRSNSSSQNSSRKHSTEILPVQFKARPAAVLYKDPFIPVKDERPLTAPAPFALSTETRAQEREDYEREKREREEKLEYFRKIAEEEQLRKDQEEIARLRKEIEYKAKPIIKYKEMIIQPSGKMTVPKSPIFQTDLLRKMKNKENNPNNLNMSC